MLNKMKDTAVNAAFATRYHVQTASRRTWVVVIIIILVAVAFGMPEQERVFVPLSKTERAQSWVLQQVDRVTGSDRAGRYERNTKTDRVLEGMRAKTKQIIEPFIK